jgi:long-chain acyl-CoA synthetase
MSSLEELAAHALARGASYPAIEWEKRWVNWEEMRRIADGVNYLLEASGADRCSPIALVPRNRPVALAALVGLIAGGRHIRMIHAYQSTAGIARDIIRLKPAVVVALDDDFSEEVRSVLAARGIAGIGLTEAGAVPIPGCEQSHALCDPPPPRPQFDLLTSGTTGPPKQFALSYDLIARDMVGTNVMTAAGNTTPLDLAPMFLFFPFGNFSGLYSNLAPMLQGVRGVLVDRFTLGSWHDYILRYRPDWAGVPPAGIQMILEANIPPEDLASLRYVRTGAAPLDVSAHREFEKRYGKPIILAYGATEFGGPVTTMTLDLHTEWGEKKFGSVGRPFGGAQLRVVDSDTGAVLPHGKEGLLEVISPRIGPHWIRTSDIAVIDEDGFLFYRGRADGAIIRGGFKLLPDTIERALSLHEAVSLAGVTGIPDKRLGQVPAIAIQLKAGMEKPTIGELERHLRNHVEATHIPAVWRFVERLPYTAMMKIDRLALRQLFDTIDESEYLRAPAKESKPTRASS